MLTSGLHAILALFAVFFVVYLPYNLYEYHFCQEKISLQITDTTCNNPDLNGNTYYCNKIKLYRSCKNDYLLTELK